MDDIRVCREIPAWVTSWPVFLAVFAVSVLIGIGIGKVMWRLVSGG